VSAAPSTQRRKLGSLVVMNW